MQEPNTAVDAYNIGGGGGGSTFTFPEVSQILPWTLPHQVQSLETAHLSGQEPGLFIPSYGGLFSMMRTSGCDDGISSDRQLGLISAESLGQVVRPSGSARFGIEAELQRLTAQDIMDAKALAASKNHSQAERRRRERINNHLAKLRSLLPSKTKTDKASLLAEVIQHMKELKRQTSLLDETIPVPTETDELTVDINASHDRDGKRMIRASICCEDRSDLLRDLIKTLKVLRLKTLRAEITTLGGRVKNVLFVTREEEEEEEESVRGTFNGGEEAQEQEHQQYCISSIQEALKAVMEKSNGDETGSGSVKRQRTDTTTSYNILEF
ncbi:Transcription factor bHLH30 [Orobanche gracilis]